MRAGDGIGVPRETVGWRGSFSKPGPLLWNSFSYTQKGQRQQKPPQMPASLGESSTSLSAEEQHADSVTQHLVHSPPLSPGTALAPLTTW